LYASASPEHRNRSDIISASSSLAQTHTHTHTLKCAGLNDVGKQTKLSHTLT